MTSYRDATGLIDAGRPAAGSAVRSVALVVVAAARAWRGGEMCSEMARAFAVVANDVSAVDFCRGFGSPVPRIPRRQARTGKVGRSDSGHHAANVVDPELGLLEVGCADAPVLRRKSLEEDVLELTVRQSL